MGTITKSFPVFDCDAHLNDFPMLWGDRYYSESEKELVKNCFWNFGDHHLINGRTVRVGRTNLDNFFYQPGYTPHGGPRLSFTDYMGPGMSKKVLRKLYHMGLSVEQLREIAHRGTQEPLPRVRDMDLMGIDGVLIITKNLVLTLPWVENARGAAAVARAYNSWLRYDYCDAAPDRLFPAAFLAPQDPFLAAEELRRVAKLGFPVGLVRPIDAQGNYPNQARFDPVWRAFEETGLVCGMHNLLSGIGEGKSQFSPGQLLDYCGLEPQMLGAAQTLSFIYEAMTWIAGILLSGFLERYPKLKMAIFESNATWLPMLLEQCDRLFRAYRSQRLVQVQELPSRTFLTRCLIAFEGDEEWVSRRHRYYRDIGIWSSDAYDHDGGDAWGAIESMRKLEVPQETQAQLMGGNARRFYGLEDRAKLFTTTAPSSIPRPKWFPKLEDIEKEYAHAGEERAGRG